jgi:hypothetical protein
MSDKKPVSAQAKGTPAKKRRGVTGLIGALLAAIGAIAFLPTTIIVVAGMLPTAVAYFVDTSREKTLGPTVLFLNFAGVFPSLLKLWHEGHVVGNAIEILMEPYMMLIILLPAAFGWLLFNYVPILVSSIIRRNAEVKIKNLEKEQEYLIEQWGGVLIHPTSVNTPKSAIAPPAAAEEHESTLA